ncbi:UvrD-helicase domain-containing protein [Rubinisphaera margarita]|uniref:UvrD-helicase domain-containing protein n=1 Tax=Rubinisphaera margarita TaxID=2909586 RepID=UPI001EE96B9D|nr:UvrD-helicase domain-containing protein [Rubinisphaera margarita]MCG6154234.1 UvrD-helicase domain-containing protein [Rubinisphaera margarita]
MPYTPQQAAAIETRNVSIALAAGAGCGKTFVLTQRFVAELMRKPCSETLDGLMAITFTDRAAREMRDRIRERVREQLASCEDDEVASWQAILRDLETARIQTIHSFCTSTLRRYSTELGIDPEFSVLDEPTATALLSQTVETQLETLLRAKNEDAFSFVLRYGLEDTLRRLRELTRQRFQLPETISVASAEAELIDFWRRFHREQYLPMKFDELKESPEVSQLQPMLGNDLASTPKWKDRQQILREHLGALEYTGSLTVESLQELREACTVQHVHKNKWISEEIYEQVRDSLKQLRIRIDALLPVLELDPVALQQGAMFGLQALRMTTQIVRAYQQQKRDQATLDFDDLLLMMRDLLQTDESVRKSLQQGTHFLLLDEFQDTDPVQTEIVRAICGDRLTSGGLFLVGDVKQSIYRFRRADPSVFRQLREQIPRPGQLSLTRNFRSQQGVLDFVNFLFAPAMPGEYDSLTAFDENEYPPRSKVEFLWSSDPDVDDGATVGDKRRIEAEWIASRIQTLLEDDTPRIREKNADGQIELRPVRNGDITILFRAFSHLGVYEDALRKAGIEYYVVSGRAFFAQQEVFDLANLCRFLDDDSDEVALVGILRSPMFGWSDDTIAEVADHSGGLWQTLSQNERVSVSDAAQAGVVGRTREILSELMDLRHRVGIGTLLRHAVTETGYDGALLTEFLGERKVANLQKLLSMADQFDQVALLGLSEFSDRLLESISEDAKEELAATHAESGDVVRLMTVHQSKGLEFPVVFVADINRRQNANRDTSVLHPRLGPLLSLPYIKGEQLTHPVLTMHRDLEAAEDESEAIRLFYVATTRAADLLVLSAYWHPDESLSGPWMTLLADRFDLTTGLARHDPLLGQMQQPGMEPQRLPHITITSEKPERRRPESEPRPTRLSKWEELLSSSEPVRPPLMALPATPTSLQPLRISVSQLEDLDAKLRTSDGQKSSGMIAASDVKLSLQESELLGHVLHAAMEHLDANEPGEIDRVLQQAADELGETLPAEVQRTAAQRLKQLFASDLLEELATAPQLHREAEFLLRWAGENGDPGATVVGTVDCLLRNERGEWHLIDYKTGRLPETPEAVLEKFGIQMCLYALAIQEWTGNYPASIRIIQLGETIREVELKITDAIIAQFRSRIHAALRQARNSLLPMPVEEPSPESLQRTVQA